MYALQHPRTCTLHTNRIYNFVLLLLTLPYLDLTVYALTFITMFFIFAFIFLLPRLVATTFGMFRLSV